ncbi:hypothetical protein U0035_01035 [Niabella yanshanensis]|uniref:Uncharacterized protein n=1 Tax=Niabella yanshanensis TaxID=577386 RepID=A0ABZ0W8B1_9BACT|nr:hypothetical protein [Niabella yanshanensis]WQD38727.1 hypothetical protein U0035_01035 [Niabella yanshanensis]
MNRPLDFSKVVYAELLDKDNKPVQQVKIAMSNAMGTGYINLPQIIASGNFLLRAYTRWMQNSGPVSFFEKQITIINMNNLPRLANADSVANKPSLAFFPEGGHIVAGVLNNVAYKLLSYTGSMDFIGYLTDGKDTVAKLLPNKDGLGKFTFTPAQGRSYTVHAGSNSEQHRTFKLPPIHDKGTAIQLSDENDKFILKGENNTADRLYHLLVHSRGHLTFGADITVNQGKFGFTFNKSELSDGVSVITLFDEKLTPVCERIIFKHPEVKLELELKTNQPTFGKRELVEVSMEAKDNGLLNDAAALSMSVFKLDSLQSVPKQNIYNYLWLGSELKGYIPDIDQYFSGGKNSATNDVELLLLTHGWRRFDWDKVISNNFEPEYLPELRGHILTATVIDSMSGSPVSGAKTFISAPSFITIFKPALSDSLGRIKAEFANFYGNQSVVAKSKTNGTTIKINNPFADVFADSFLPHLQRPVNYPNTILKQSINAQVQSVYYNDSLYQFYLPPFADSSAFFGKADFNYQLDNYTRFRTVEEVLREYVSLVNVRRRRDEVSLQVINPEQKQMLANPPLNLLDGVPVSDFSKFFEVDPLTIRSLDLVAKRYVLGSEVFDAILSWKSYDPVVAKHPVESGETKVDYEGLLLHRKFYSPIYSTLSHSEANLPDFRNLLQWQPDINLKGGVSSKVAFYTSDLKGRYAIIVQGISSKGLPVIKTGHFEVK